MPTVAVEQLVLPPRRRRGAWLKRAVASTVSCTIAVGDRTADDVHRLFGISRKRITVVHNGIAASVPEAHEFGDRPVVGCVARYEDQKALDRLIRAMVELPDARLVLCGDGSLRAELEDLALQLGVAARVDVGPWRPAARAWIGGFDAFVLPSRDEAFPLTIVEAMLAGTPVVATDVGSVREAVIDDVTGLLVPSGDHDALVAAIRRVLGDADLAARVSGAAERLALERFTADQMARGYEAVWRRVLS
jgi:glycosyltransferase involved in cell wall biosynthesis